MPLNNLLKKNQNWNWTPECQQSFQKLKDSLISKPILAIFNPNYPCHLYVDASKTAISCILKQQKPNGNQHPIAFHSRRLRNYEINYTITELECLAIIDSLDKFHCYLHGSHFTVHTDHNALVWLKNFKNPTGRLFRWSLKVSMYDFDIKYKKGSTNVEADMLTRNPIAYHIINTPPEPLLDINEIIHFQNIENISAPKCFKRDDVFVVKRQGLTKIIVPKALRVKLMETTHEKFGHPGVATMLKLISPQYYWINIITDIRNYVKHCETCQINKKSHQRKYGLMQSLPLCEKPFELLSIDSVGGLNYYNSVKNIYTLLLIMQLDSLEMALFLSAPRDKASEQLNEYKKSQEDEVEKLAYQLNEEAERTGRPIRRLSKMMYGSTCADMQVDVMGECLSSIKHVVGTTSGCIYPRSNHWEVGGTPQCDKCSEEFGIAHSIVSRLWRQFQITGTAIRGFSSGRPRGTTPIDDRYIVLQARRNRRQTAAEIARNTTQETGRPISRFTVARRLHGGGLFARRPVRCVPLTPAHRRRRSLWCREHRDWRDNEWGRVLFTDERRFSLSSDSHRILIWRERGSRNHPSNIIERDRYGGRGVLVWGGIMLGSRTDLHIFDAGSVNGTRYCNEILLPYVRLFRGAMGLQFLFMDDKVPCHRTVAAK
ncbi:hypothetical protein TNCV_68301 [Trichonephila clavipes]|nr:hypothetical protein TNCV_68301 [Trichonephila clavipes]